MNNFLRTSTAMLVTIFLVGCSGATEGSMEPVQNDDHHEGEENVPPHGHTPTELSTGDDTDIKLPPSRSRLDAANDDHHEGEENVAPHEH